MAKRRSMDRSRYLIYRALMPDALPTEVLRRAVRELVVVSLLEERLLREAGAGHDLPPMTGPVGMYPL